MEEGCRDTDGAGLLDGLDVGELLVLGACVAFEAGSSGAGVWPVVSEAISFDEGCGDTVGAGLYETDSMKAMSKQMELDCETDLRLASWLYWMLE
jgi:hypothetical protein